nr:uncharacterized protein LOC109404351 [Aedes albopictus]
MLVNHILSCALLVALISIQPSRAQNCVSGPPHYLCPQNANFLEVYIPHEVYCNRFYKCVKGQAVESRCQSGTYFNPVMNLCCPSEEFCVRPEPVLKQFPQCISCAQQFISCEGRPLPRFYVCNCDGDAVEQYCPWAQNMCSGKNVTLLFINGRCQPEPEDMVPIPVKIQVVQEVVATAEAYASAGAGIQMGGGAPPPPGVAPAAAAATTTTEAPTTTEEPTTEGSGGSRKREAPLDLHEFEVPAIEAGPIEVDVQNEPAPTTTVEIPTELNVPPDQQPSSSVVQPNTAEALTAPKILTQSKTVDAFLLVPGMSLVPGNHQQLVWQVDSVPLVHATK